MLNAFSQQDTQVSRVQTPAKMDFSFLGPARWEGAGSAPLPKSEVKSSKIQAALTAHDSPQRSIGGVSHAVVRQTDLLQPQTSAKMDFFFKPVGPGHVHFP